MPYWFIYGELWRRQQEDNVIVVILSTLHTAVSGLKCVIIVQTEKCSLNIAANVYEMIYQNKQSHWLGLLFLFLSVATAHLCLCNGLMPTAISAAAMIGFHSAPMPAGRPTECVNKAFILVFWNKQHKKEFNIFPLDHFVLHFSSAVNSACLYRNNADKKLHTWGLSINQFRLFNSIAKLAYSKFATQRTPRWNEHEPQLYPNIVPNFFRSQLIPHQVLAEFGSRFETAALYSH